MNSSSCAKVGEDGEAVGRGAGNRKERVGWGNTDEAGSRGGMEAKADEVAEGEATGEAEGLSMTSTSSSSSSFRFSSFRAPFLGTEGRVGGGRHSQSGVEASSSSPVSRTSISASTCRGFRHDSSSASETVPVACRVEPRRPREMMALSAASGIDGRRRPSRPRAAAAAAVAWPASPEPLREDVWS